MAKMLAREVRERLRGRIDPEALFVLEALAEQASVQQHAINEMAAAINQMSDIIAQVVTHGASMNDKFKALGIKEVDDDGPVTQ